jgi:hypothetical protein
MVIFTGINFVIEEVNSVGVLTGANLACTVLIALTHIPLDKYTKMHKSYLAPLRSTKWYLVH